MSDGFGLDNLPYGAVARGDGPAQLAVRLGDDAVFLDVLEEAGLSWRPGCRRGRSPARC